MRTRVSLSMAGAREEVAMMRSPHPLNAPTFTLLAGTTSGFDYDLSPPKAEDTTMKLEMCTRPQGTIPWAGI